MPTVYLAKASDQVISHCRCERPLVGSPGQMDCPWCGCGWLFICGSCGKAFTFAVGVEVDQSLQDIARSVLLRECRRAPTDEEISGWVSAMEIMLQDITVGQTYVYLDGYYIPAECENVVFDGWYAHHDLPRLPQSAAIADPRILDATLAQQTYWTQRRLRD